MGNGDLTDEELRQVAAEAGVSPHELRTALAQRDHAVVPARFGPPPRGSSTRHIEGRLPLPSDTALAAVRGSIERQTGRRGHAQGPNEVDIVDDDAGLTYRLRSRNDSGGALLRIDIDASQGKGTQALATTGVAGITATMLALGFLFQTALLWLGGIGIGIIGAALVFRSALGLRRAVTSATATAAHALVEVEDKAAINALPPSPPHPSLRGR